MWGGAEAASATGGHLPSEDDATGPLFDPLTSPLPDETATGGDGWERVQPQRRPTEATPYAPAPETRPAVPSRRTAQTRTGSRAVRGRGRAPLRRVKRTLRHVDPISVLKVSLIYYACLLVIWLIIVAIIFSFLKSLGLFDQIDKIAKGFVLGKGKFEITLGAVEKWAFLIGATLTVLGSLINVFLAFLYNAISDAVGGIEMTFVERDVSETRG